MSHALVRTSPKGGPFLGRCIKCHKEGLDLAAGMKDCPADDVVSDASALLHILRAPPKAGAQPGEG